MNERQWYEKFVHTMGTRLQRLSVTDDTKYGCYAEGERPIPMWDNFDAYFGEDHLMRVADACQTLE